ncbi:MAG: cyclic 2,3-diphosphoglycerate synthase [Spirochaetota bacterium]
MKKILICGAAGRDFHNFNVLYRDNPNYKVVAFTAAQIPNIDGRKYPPELAGSLYPDGIPIFPEEELARLIQKHKVEEVVFSYSDVPHAHVMHIGSIATAAGASFILNSPVQTMIKSLKPVVSVCAVRTGCGKSQTTRAVSDILSAAGKRVVTIRHPMPYGNLSAQSVQRFASIEDLHKHHCTIEEMEEYEPHINRGRIIYAGVDYAAILKEAEKEADIILWDGGNNDTPFYYANLEIVVVDPHRPGHELSYYPGETNFLRAQVIVINKMDSAEPEKIAQVESNIKKYNPKAQVIKADSSLELDKPELIKGKRVLVVEDGPTLTHGEMQYGAGVVAARRFNAQALVDPRPWTAGTITETFKKYPGIGSLLPAMGYGERQIKDLEATINKTDCDTVIIATPIDLGRLIKINKPTVRVRYELKERSKPGLREILKERFL